MIHYLHEFSGREVYCGRDADTLESTITLSRVSCPDCLTPRDEISYWIGHREAKGQLRKLLAKVDEARHAAVIKSYLMETIDDEVRDLRDNQPATDADLP